VSEISGNGHENSVWSISWSHPRFGPLLASCGFDKKVIIWKESSPNVWNKLYEYSDNKNSVNTLSFAPNEYGLILICGSVDGNISIHEYKNENWNAVKLFGHGFGVNGVSWGPCSYLGNENLAPLRFVSCGNDNLIKIWQTKDNRIESFYVVATLEAHDNVVRDVQWRCNNNYSYDYICSGGDVNIYKAYSYI
jgi:protein transport protein SEC13